MTEMTESTYAFFETLAKILLRCWLFGLLLLAIWVGAFLLAGDVICRLHGSLFGLSPHELSHGGMAFVKLVVILLFFFPWAAIRLVLRKRSV